MANPWEAFQPAAAEAGPWQSFQPPATAPGASEEHGTISNLARGIGERAGQVGGGLARFAGQTAEELGDWLEEKVPLGKIVIDESGIHHEATAPGELKSRQLQPVIDLAKKGETLDLGYEPGTTWEDVKKRPLSNFIPFALEQGIVSAPDMAAVMYTLPAYVASQTSQIGTQRAGNEGRPEATVNDFVKAMPAAVASALMERIGTKGILGVDDAVTALKHVPGAVAKASAKEGLTEAGQNVVEYAGATVGTPGGFNPKTAAEQGLMGLVGGAPFGGAARTVTATGQALLGSPDVGAPPSNLSIEDMVTKSEADVPNPTLILPDNPDTAATPPVVPAGEGVPKGGDVPPDQTGVLPPSITSSPATQEGHITLETLPKNTMEITTGGAYSGPSEALKEARKAARDFKMSEEAKSKGVLESAKTLRKQAQDSLDRAVKLGFKMERKAQASEAPSTGAVTPPTAPSASSGIQWHPVGPDGSAAYASPDRTLHVILKNGKYYGWVSDKANGGEPQLLDRTYDTMAEAQEALGKFKGEVAVPKGSFRYQVVQQMPINSGKQNPPIAVYDTLGEARKAAKELSAASPGRVHRVAPIRPGEEGVQGEPPQGLVETVAATGANAEKLVADTSYFRNNPFRLFQLSSWPKLQAAIAGGKNLHVDGAFADRPLIEKFLLPFMKRMTPDLKLIVSLDPNSPLALAGSDGAFYGFQGGYAYIWISPKAQGNQAKFLATLAHEYGHAVMAHRFASASSDVQQALYAAFQAQVKKHFGTESQTTAQEFLTDLYSPANIGHFANLGERYSVHSAKELLAKSSNLNDWYSFDEWMAEQTAKWMTLTERPLSIADKFFKGVANAVKDVLRAMWNSIGKDYESNLKAFAPTEAAKLWLDDMLDQKRRTAPASLIGAKESYIRGLRENAKILGVPVSQAAPPQAANLIARSAPPSAGVSKKALAQSDRYVSWLRFWPNVLQLAWKNPHIQGLQRYVEIVRQWHIDKMKVVTNADATVKLWRKLGKEPGERLSKFLFAMDRMEYLPPGQNGRWPTLPEMVALAKKYGLTQKELTVYTKIKGDFLGVLDQIEAAWIKDATRTFTNPQILAREIYNIRTEMNALRSRPYFPHERFGDWTVTVFDTKGSVIHFEQVMSAKEADRLAATLKAQPQFAGLRVGAGKLAEEVKIFRGLPPSLIKQLASRIPNITPQQQAQLEQLAFDMSPANSFAKKFAKRKGTAGYSLDAMRGYASYFLHAGSHIARLTWRADMEDGVKDVSGTARSMVGTHTADAVGKRQGIADYMARHLEYIMNPQNEWTALRTFAFVWHLGFNVSSALVNITQVPMVAYPYLASRFNDFSAMNQLRKASMDLHKFFSLKGKLPQDEIDAIKLGIEMGTLDESMAADLAGAAQYGVLGRIVPGTALERARQKIAYASAFLFQTAEKVNRRVVFPAAYRLAKANPANRHVQEVSAANQVLYQKLVAQGWSPTNANAFLFARDSIDKSMFNYSAYARPEFIRGKKGVFFAFWMFKQNMLYFFKNDPGAMRALMILAATSGLMGLPFGQDLLDIIKYGAGMFGADFDPEREARQLVVELAGEDDTGRRTAEVIMHGLGKESMGMTWAGEALGVPIPGFDISNRLSMGAMVPGLRPLLQGAAGQISPYESVGKAASETVGASYGIPLTILRSLETGDLDDFKTWERMLPSAAKNAIRAYRYWNEGAEVNKSGAEVTNFDVTDTRQAAEVLGQAIGLTPTRLSRQWDQQAMQRDAVNYWVIRRKMLFEQFDKARQTKDREALGDARQALKQFNREAPDKRLRISAGDIIASGREREKNRKLMEQGKTLQKTYRGIGQDVSDIFPSDATTSSVP